MKFYEMQILFRMLLLIIKMLTFIISKTRTVSKMEIEYFDNVSKELDTSVTEWETRKGQ